jgi:regulator of protease activity HflC (stomatin/prohibitin superfamily)
VDALTKPRTWVVLGATALGLFLLYQLWVWEVERVEVPADHFLVKINLWGKDLPEGEIVAPNDSYKGIQRKVLTEGRHFLNPILYTYEKHKALNVPKGQCAVLTRKAGTEIPAEDKTRGVFLAAGEFDQFADKDPGQRGILRDYLSPGKYYVNPYEYSYEMVNAVEVKSEQVGVKVLKWGKDPRELQDRRSPYVVPEGYRGVQEKPVEPGTHYLNPYVEAIVPVDTRSHPVEFADIVFPSRDGFLIQPHVMVAYKVVPAMAPELFCMLCDEGQLPQADSTPEEQRKNPILQKFVLPLIRGHVRIQGSNYDARDYVSYSTKADEKGAATFNPREKLQKELMDKVAPACKKVGVIIETITVSQPEMNKDLAKLADSIFERVQTRQVRDKNKQLIEQYTQEKELQGTLALEKRQEALGDANRKLEQEKIQAEQRKKVEQAKLEAELKAAHTTLEGARKKAEGIRITAKNQAKVTMAKNQAEVAGLKTKISGFSSPEQFAQYEVLQKLSPALSEIFASDQSEFAKLFTAYMNGAPPKKGAAGAGEGRTADAKKPGE